MIGELDAKQPEGCYPCRYTVVSVRQHNLSPRTPPPLWGTSPHRGGYTSYAMSPSTRPRKIQKVRVKAEHTVVITMTLAVRVPSWPRFRAMM